MSDNQLLFIDLDESAFSHFPCYEGTIPAGYRGNWLGVLTRANVWSFPHEFVQKKYHQNRNEQFTYPIDDEHILCWNSLLQSVIRAKKHFCMAAIGCGWGRWLSAGAFAANFLKKRFFLNRG